MAQNIEGSTSANVAGIGFKAELALILHDLGNRLDLLFEQCTECLPKAPCSVDHDDHQKKPLQIETDIAPPSSPNPSELTPMAPVSSRPSQLTPSPPSPNEIPFLPGSLGSPHEAPGLRQAGTALSLSASQPSCTPSRSWKRARMRTRVTTIESLPYSRESVLAKQDVMIRDIWSEEHTIRQKKAIDKHVDSFRVVAVEKLPRHTQWGILRGHGRQAHFARAKIMLSSGGSFVKPKWDTLHPAGEIRTLWNFASLFLICLDALTVPLLAFDVGYSGPWEVMAWFCTFFWTADMIVSFRTGYFAGAQVELRPAMVAKHYAKTWFAFDLIVVVFEWFSRFYHWFAPSGVVRTTRVVRGVRLVKLLRITKMRGLLTEFAAKLNSNILSLILDVFFLSTLMCTVCHFVTCVWYALGKSASDGWTGNDAYAIQQGSDEMGFVYWYLSSARWVISQVNGRTDMDETRNMAERGFTVATGVVLSIVARSVFVALITRSVLQLSELYKKQEERRRSVNDYLRLHPVPTTMRRTVKAHAHEYTDIDVERQREVLVLGILPKHLQKDLVYEARKPLLQEHSLFRVFMQGYSADWHHACIDAVKQRHAVSQEMLFKAKDPCSRMLILDTGALVYGLCASATLAAESEDGYEEDAEEDDTPAGMVLPTLMSQASALLRITHGMWVSEAAIWATWSNKGTLTSEGHSCMLEVDATIFSSALQPHTDLFGLAVVYARQFLTFIAKEALLSDYLSFEVMSDSDANQVEPGAASQSRSIFIRH